MSVKTYKKGAEKKLTNHFNLSEMHCHGNGCCTTTKLDDDLVELVEKLRLYFNKPIHIESGYRCPKHNIEVGGNSNSSHCKGMAVDIIIAGISSSRIVVGAELKGFPRLGIYSNKPNMMHGGTGSKLHWIGTGNYLPSSHSFIPCEWARPISKNAKGQKYYRGVTKLSRKKYIAWMQANLYSKGFKGKDGKELVMDGSFGKNTIYAVNQFLKSIGFKQVGYLSRKASSLLAK